MAEITQAHRPWESPEDHQSSYGFGVWQATFPCSNVNPFTSTTFGGGEADLPSESSPDDALPAPSAPTAAQPSAPSPPTPLQPISKPASWQRDRGHDGQTVLDELLRWLTTPGVWLAWKGQDSRKTKGQLVKEFNERLRLAGFREERTSVAITRKVQEVTKKYQRALKHTNATGNDVGTHADNNMTFRGEVEEICPYFYQLHDVFCDRVMFNPRASHGTGDDTDPSRDTMATRTTTIGRRRRGDDESDDGEVDSFDAEDTEGWTSESPAPLTTPVFARGRGSSVYPTPSLSSRPSRPSHETPTRSRGYDDVLMRVLGTLQAASEGTERRENEKLALERERLAAKERWRWVDEYNRLEAKGESHDFILELLGPKP